MRVLIIGAKGMLGQALVRVFNAPQPPLTIRGGRFSPLRVRGGEEGLRVEWELLAWDREDLDITDHSAVMQKIVDPFLSRPAEKWIAPSLIINAAAYNDVDGAETDPTTANRVNGDAVGYLAEAAAKIGATFVHYSTDYVFDGIKKDGYREDDKPNPVSAYGQSKLLGERAVLSLRGVPELDEGRRGNPMVYLIRTSRLFGKQGNGKKSFVDTMLERIQNTEDRPLDSRGRSSVIEVVDEEFASPTYVEDLARRTREIIRQKKPSGIYHVTNSGSTTWYKFAKEIFAQAHELGIIIKVPSVKPVSASHFPRPAKRPAYSQLLNTKLPPMRSWQEALHAYLLARSETS